MKVTLLRTPDFTDTLIAMRLPMNGKSDIKFYKTTGKIHQDDIVLLQKLVKAGPDHSKAIRGTWVSFLIEAPRYWWSEIDTYCIGKQPLSSTSTMHKITSRDLIEDDFEQKAVFPDVLVTLNKIRNSDMSKTEKTLEMKKHLPESFLQTRLLQINYQSLRNIYRQRKNHRLREWKTFCSVIKELPYFKLFIE